MDEDHDADASLDSRNQSSDISSPQSCSEQASEQASKHSDGRPRRIKAHKKTRQGCFNCKRRKVKCSEEKPSCTPCVRNGLRCVYPLTREASDPINRQIQLGAPQAQAMAELHSGKLEYTALDMRLLHVFIVNAYPHLPLKCDFIWTHDVPAMAHSYTFLMHSILALGASHMVRDGDYALTPAAHFHRLRAMQGVNEALARDDRSVNDDDALIAACYALAFQVACIGDDPSAFWICVRTIAVVNAEIMNKGRPDSKFLEYTAPQRHNDTMVDKLKCFPLLRIAVLDEGLRSLESMAHLCTEGLELQLYTLIHKTFCSLKRSSMEGYMAFAMIYTCVAIMPTYEFCRLTNPSEHIVQLLQSHFMAIQTFMGPIISQEWSGRREFIPQHSATETQSTARWAAGLCKLPRDSALQQHLQWPDKIQQLAAQGELWLDPFEPGLPVYADLLSSY